MRRTLATAVAFLSLLTGGAEVARAQSGGESAGSAEDLDVRVDDRWVGGQRGGYWPVRVEVFNRGPARTVTAAFLPYDARRGGGRPPLVSRAVPLPAGRSARFTLPIPLTAGRSDGEVVFVAAPSDGAASEAGAAEARPADELLDAALRDLTHQVNPPVADDNAVRAPAVLVLDGAAFDGGAFEDAAAAVVTAIERDGARSDERRTVARARGDVLTLPSDDLPDDWLGFTTVDVLVADADTLSGLPGAVRDAVRDWLAAGGALVVPGGMAAADRPLPPGVARSLGVRAEPDGWVDTAADGPGGPRDLAGPLLDRLRDFRGLEETVRQFEGMRAVPRTPPGLAPRRANVGGGRVYATAGGGGAGDWFVILSDLGPDRLTAADRFGVGGRGPNAEFAEFLIPGVQGVPVGTLVFLITLFVVLIGPANYLYLRRRRQVGRLAVTVPLIAAATSGTLLVFATVMHGFGVKARQLSVTVHDPAAGRAVEFARTAVFAPRTPVGGLTFPADAAVWPLAPPGPSAGGGRVDWTGGQRWGGDLFRGRTRTQFVTVTPRAERGRLTVEGSPTGDALTVVNGYGEDFALLALAAADGRVFHGADLSAGGRGTLRPIEGDDLFLWRETLDPLLPEPRPKADDSAADLLGELPMLRSQRDTNASFRASLAFRTAAAFRGFNEKTSPLDVFAAAPLVASPRGSFVALLADREEAEFGGLPADARGGARLLIGRISDRAAAGPQSDEEQTEPGAGVTVRRPGGGR